MCICEVIFYCRINVFLLKQKTAYEMRISDWSSDVCSSDLSVGTRRADLAPFERLAQAIKDSALKFRQLIKEQHAQMRQTYLTWPDLQSPAHKRRHRSAMMRRAIRPKIGRASCRGRVGQYV